MKIYSFPFALTLESSLKVAEIELLQKQDPRSLALLEVTPQGEEIETFRLGYSNDEYGSVSAKNIVFVGETENGYAGLSIMIPASLKGDAVGTYIDSKLAAISRNVAIVEANAKKALVNVEAAKKSFLKSIIPLKATEVVEEKTEVVKEKKENGGKK